MLVRHDALVEITFKTGRKVIQKDIIPVQDIDAHVTVFTVIHGGISGMVNWNHLGKAIDRPKYTLKLVNPDRDILKDGQFCPCDECKENDNASDS